MCSYNLYIRSSQIGHYEEDIHHLESEIDELRKKLHSLENSLQEAKKAINKKEVEEAYEKISNLEDMQSELRHQVRQWHSENYMVRLRVIMYMYIMTTSILVCIYTLHGLACNRCCLNCFVNVQICILIQPT